MVAAAAVVVVGLGALSVASWRAHWPAAVFGSAAPQALTWSATEAPLPADATRTASQAAGLNDVVCAGVDSCVAVGNYVASSNGNAGHSNSLIETFSHGTWTPATAPVDVAAASQVTFAELAGVACPSQGSYVAVGVYFDSQNAERPLIQTLSGSTWTSAKPALPGDAAQGKSAFLGEVACPAQGTCVATGWYTDQNGDTQGLIDTLSGGTWTAARAPVPAGALPRKASSSLPTALFVVKCPAVGTCVATGDYTGQNGGTQGLIDTLSGGTWTAATAPLPDDAAAANPGVYLWAIACPAPGTCQAAGHYSSRNGQSRDLIETLSDGKWTPAAAPLPADAAANQTWSTSHLTGLTSVACEAASTCLAAGSYTARNGTIQGVIGTLSDGTWTAARAPLPAGAAMAKQDVFFDSAVCPSSGDCIAVGGYKTQAGGTQGLIETGT